MEKDKKRVPREKRKPKGTLVKRVDWKPKVIETPDGPCVVDDPFDADRIELPLPLPWEKVQVLWPILRRKPEYRQFWALYDKATSSEEREKLRFECLQRWGLDGPRDPVLGDDEVDPADFSLKHRPIMPLGYEETGRRMKFVVDFDYRKEEILQDLAAWLDFFGPMPKYRYRPQKTLLALQTWDFYDQFKSFSKVAWKMNEPESTVKARYYRAFELIMEEKYDKYSSQRRLTELAKSLAKSPCESCLDRDNCSVECPELLAILNLEYVGRKESLGKHKDVRDPSEQK